MFEGNEPTPKWRRKKVKVKVADHETTRGNMGNAAHHNGAPRDALDEEQPNMTLVM
jgi:hypothetical protein